MTDTTTTDTTTEATTAGGDKTFTQAEVDQIVKSRAERLAKQMYPDYDELKSKASGAQTLEQKLADLESKHAEAEARALRSDIAARYGISTEKGPNGEPSDADLFLIGSDEATLETQAKRLAERTADQKKQGNRAPKEGRNPTITTGDEDMRGAVRTLFGRSDN